MGWRRHILHVHRSPADNTSPGRVHPDNVSGIDPSTTFEGNTEAHLEVGFANTDVVMTPATWRALGVSLRIRDRFLVRSGLTLAPGLVLEMADTAGVIVEHGSLTAEDAVDAPILFRGSSAGTPGHWPGITFEARRTGGFGLWRGSGADETCRTVDMSATQGVYDVETDGTSIGCAP